MSGEVTMVRTLAFSSGHRYWDASLTAAENRATFGTFASPYNHGHNYVLEVAVRGAVDPATGMVVNIKDIDQIVRRKVLAAYDGRSINDEVPGFGRKAPTLENILADVAARIRDAMPARCPLVAIKLAETATLFAELDLLTMQTTLSRSYEFAAAHRLHAPALSVGENEALFGKCNNPAGHGHNYVLEVTVGGEPDAATGMICDLAALDAAVKERVVDRYDHKNLNEDLPEFAGRPTSSEFVAQEIFARLDGTLPAELRRVRLWETARNLFEVVR